MAAPAELQVIAPNPTQAGEVVAFHAAMLAEQFADARAEPEHIQAHVAEMTSPDGVAAYRRNMERWTSTDGVCHKVVEGEAGVRGLFLAVRAGTEVAGDRRTSLNEVWVVEMAPELRGTGTASALMGDFFQNYADPSRFTRLSVLFANVRARTYYGQRWGFTGVDYEATMRVGPSSARALIMSRLPEATRSKA